MTILDIITIYLACGSPFAVHRLVTQTGDSGLSFYLSVILRLFMWPAFAAGGAYRLFTELRSNEKDRYEEVSSRLLVIRTEIERSIVSADPAHSIFQFRDTFDRYVGLSIENYGTTDAMPSSEIFEISEHSSPDIANVCLWRKNRSRVGSHLAKARSDLVEALFSGARGGATVFEAAARAAEIVGDRTGASVFAGLNSEKADLSTDIEHKAQELWRSQRRESQPAA